MKHPLIHLALLSTLALSLPRAVAAEESALPATAEQALREGRPAEALRLLQEPGCSLPPAEAAYWRGQALIRLGRTEDAAEAFYRVPTDHPLYPYAARGILYCARVSPRIHFVEVCAPLTVSADDETAQMALALLAEYQLRYTKQGDPSALVQLQRLAEEKPEYAPLVKLLGIHTYRRDGDFAGGIEYARALEQDASLTPLMRQRVRLALAELYYDKEKATPAAAADNEDEGKGEETLMQFITANPDSPLLEEAFRRLQQHRAIAESEYTREKLQEWGEDSIHPRRAALALYYLHSAQLSPAYSAATANRAAASLPGEPTTRSILLEHVRRLLEQRRSDDAQRYLALLVSLPGAAELPYTLFLQAQSLEHAPREAMQLYLRCAESADSTLYTPAMVNALICAMRSGDEESAEALLQAPVGERTSRALLLAHAGLILQRDPERARRELAQVRQMHPSPAQAIDVMLDEALLDLPTRADQKIPEALLACTAEQRRAWSPEQVLRYAALLEKAEETLGMQRGTTLADLYEESTSLSIKVPLALHRADLLARTGKHKEALKLLLDAAEPQATGESKAATLLYAGHEAAEQGNLAGLEHAVRLYAESARQGSDLTPRALIEQAAVLVRINRAAEAHDLLQRLEQSERKLTPDEQAHILTMRADAADRTPEGAAVAMEACRKIETIEGLPPAWISRARLQHAALCARVHRYAEALADYRAVMQSERAKANPADEHSSFLFYYAGAGAVYQLLQMEQYSEAAALAEEVAAWPGTTAAPAENRSAKAESFSRWAQSIRQTHYLPSTMFDSEGLL